MQEVTKVIMFVYRERDKKEEYLILNREKDDTVVPTGHVGDQVIDETIDEAVKREIKEELGIDPLEITNINYKYTVYLPSRDKLSTEHTFLIKIPPQDVKFLEDNSMPNWVSLEELPDKLTYSNQQSAAEVIQGYLKEKKTSK